MSEEMTANGAESVESVVTAGTEEQAEAQVDLNKKYTDSDVDRIVAKKIAAERSKAAKQQNEELEQREREVLRRELVIEARERLADKQLPSSLVDLMNYGSKEEFEESYDKVTGVFTEVAKPKITGRVPHNPDSGYASRDIIAGAFAPPTR